MDAGLNVSKPVRRKIRLKPASGRESDTKPSAAIASSKPRWRLANSAEATGSATLRERAEAVMVNTVRCIAYDVRNVTRTPLGSAAGATARPPPPPVDRRARPRRDGDRRPGGPRGADD